ncbi:MAG TPA: tetratricopeptide repeat protein [Ideonella sp.]|nr:tetratricopeptide repeat protein [Ideonella sp.]
MDTTTVCLRLFGSPTVEHAGASQALPLERRSQLAVLLALRRGWAPRAELASLLWPEQPSKRAYTNLRKTLFRLQAVPWAAAVESQGTALRWQVRTDVLDFESALHEQRPADALSAYRGELLAGFDDGQNEAWTLWLTFERERLRAAWRGAALAHLAGDVAAADAIALSMRLLEADPLDEAALREHMAALARDGQAAAARQAWRRFVDSLSQDLGLEPGAELRALHDAVGSLPRPAEPLALPAADDGFVGRSIELRRIADLLARPECRLLCLTGPGGMGKTRLARRAMKDLAPSFPDGAVFVALEDMATPAQFGLRLAQEAGVAPGRGSGDALARAVEAWRDRRMLLVLDNFESLVEHASLLQRLLQGCAQLSMLVTSRVRLTVADEWAMPLEGLPCPDPEDDDRAEAFDAVRLFVKAALRVAPAFAPAAESAAIVDICRQVEGLPLALELAAAWVRVLPCQAIASELRQGTELLQASDASHPARHASIEVVFDHSWHLLSAVEREVLARLSVFRGGFSVEAARAVAGASLPVLGALADKSLLARTGGRMRLHPLVQQLAGLRLGEGDARRAAEAAGAAYFQRWLEQLKPAVEDGKRAALQAIDADYENCRRAWWISTREGQSDALARNARTLLSYCDYRGRAEEGLGWLRQTIDAPLGQADAALRALLLSQASHLEYRLGRYEEALASAASALASSRPKQDRDARVQALTVLASCALQQGRLPDARRCYKQALALASAQSVAHNTAATLDNLSLVERRMGHYDESLRLSLESLAQHRRIGDQAGVALCLNNLATNYLFRQEYAAARDHLLESLAICEREGLISTQAFVLSSLTELALKTGDLASAERYVPRALEVADSTGNRPVACWMTMQVARLALQRLELDTARTALAAGSSTALALGMPALYAQAMLVFAELLDAQQEPSCARRVLAFAVDHPSITTVDRDELRVEWARRARPASADPPWPGIGLDELLRRIASERELAHVPLIAALRGAT